MKKNTLLLFGIFLAASFFGYSQTTQGWCGTDKQLQNRINLAPELIEEIQKSMSNATSFQGGGEKALKTVPVVFHILHSNGIGNISNEQIQSALDVLNKDFNRLNADTAQTRLTANAPFKTQAASMEMEFKLAKIDPNGNCTNGIIRKNVADYVTYEADMDAEYHKYTAQGGSSAWPRNKYFNIWIVNSIGVPDASGTTLGYAQFPTSWGGPAATYGLVMRQDFTGTIGTAAGNDGRTVTHEVGHCFGLFHIFQGPWDGSSACHTSDCYNDGDYCCDTPPQAAANWTCSPTWNSCNEVPINDTYGFDALDQIENYMSYNSCQNMFSFDQATIMESNIADLTYLTNLTSASNATITGINLPAVLCDADFTSNKAIVCVGDQIQFTDMSFDAVTGWAWSFPSGTPSTSMDQNPIVTYSTPGIYEVTLTATDGTNSNSETKTQFVKVLPESDYLPFFDGFESYSTLANLTNWEVVNYDSNNAFEIDNTTSHSGSKCVKLTNFGQTGSNIDELIAAPVDLSGVASEGGVVTLSFRYAYRKKLTADYECLKVFLTNDCGDTWSQRKTLCGAQLSAVTSTTSWSPTSAADWVTVHMVNVTSDYWVDNFNYKFKFEGDNGNNLFLDDINIYLGAPSDAIVLGLNESHDLNELSLYPNPAEDELNLNFSVNQAQTVLVQILDLYGKAVQNHYVNAAIGSNLVMMDTKQFASGIYFVNVVAGDSKKVVQFIVK